MTALANGALRAGSSAPDDDEMMTGRCASAIEPVLHPSIGRCGISRMAESGSVVVHAARLPRPAGDFDTVAQAELGLDVCQVRLHRAERDEQLVADLLIGSAAGHRNDDLFLTIGEFVDAVAAGCAGSGEVLKEPNGDRGGGEE